MASGNDEQRSGLAGAAGRAAFFPARTAARAWRDQFESAVDEVLSAPEIARLIDHALAAPLPDEIARSIARHRVVDRLVAEFASSGELDRLLSAALASPQAFELADRVLAGPFPDEVARSIVRHRVIERVVAELASSGELDRLLSAALASPRALELIDRVLASDATGHALQEVAARPEIRDAILHQTAGFFEEVLRIVRASAVQLDGRVERAVRRRERPRHTVFAGIVTRALALAVDGAATIGIHLLLVAVVALVASLVGGLHPQWLVGVLLGLGWILIAGGYFVLFWSTTGQTPGMRLFRLRVHNAEGAAPSVGRSIVRMVGLVLSIAVFFVGFVPVLFDERRRGLPDFLAGTVVKYEDEQV